MPVKRRTEPGYSGQRMAETLLEPTIEDVNQAIGELFGIAKDIDRALEGTTANTLGADGDRKSVV